MINCLIKLISTEMVPTVVSLGLIGSNVVSFKQMKNNIESGPLMLDLVSKKKYSVLGVTNCFKSISRKIINYKFLTRRIWDLAENFANASLAKNFPNLEYTNSPAGMCSDALNVAGGDYAL
jgi:UDP-glucose 4-epimerase